MTPLPDRIASKIAFVGSDASCWLWMAALTVKGYGEVSFEGRPHPAHRIVYQHLVGPIPDGQVLDHLCRVRRCVNPAHLEPVTNRENLRRGDHGNQYSNEARTHCGRGHHLTADNVYSARWWQECRACRSEATRAYRRRAKATA